MTQTHADKTPLNQAVGRYARFTIREMADHDINALKYLRKSVFICR